MRNWMNDVTSHNWHLFVYLICIFNKSIIVLLNSGSSFRYGFVLDLVFDVLMLRLSQL